MDNSEWLETGSAFLFTCALPSQRLVWSIDLYRYRADFFAIILSGSADHHAHANLLPNLTLVLWGIHYQVHLLTTTCGVTYRWKKIIDIQLTFDWMDAVFFATTLVQKALGNGPHHHLLAHELMCITGLLGRNGFADKFLDTTQCLLQDFVVL